jgi:hypothetical protein
MNETSIPASVEMNTGDPSARYPEPNEFLAFHGGPFFQLQKRLKLLRQNALRVGPRAVFFVALAWGVPFLLSLPRSFSSEHGQGAYLADLGVFAKFFIGIGAFVLAEQQVENGLKVKLSQLLLAPIIAPRGQDAPAHEIGPAANPTRVREEYPQNVRSRYVLGNYCPNRISVALTSTALRLPLTSKYLSA